MSPRFWGILALLGWRLHQSSLCPHHHLAFSPSVSPNLPLLIRTLVTGLWPTLTQYEQPRLSLMTSAKSLFPNKVPVTGARVRIWTYLFGGCSSTHSTVCVENINVEEIRPCGVSMLGNSMAQLTPGGNQGRGMLRAGAGHVLSRTDEGLHPAGVHSAHSPWSRLCQRWTT